jgi:hypothetical protein
VLVHRTCRIGPFHDDAASLVLIAPVLLILLVWHQRKTQTVCFRWLVDDFNSEHLIATIIITTTTTLVATTIVITTITIAIP